MLKLNFSSDFCGSVMEDIFNDNIKVIIDKKGATITIKDYVSELETIISPGENELFFFFTVDGVLYRLRIYKGGKY
jgi:hemin uptake protein HemP